MDHQKRLTSSTLRVAVLAVLALFLIPGLTYGLSGLILGDWDQKFASNVLQKAAQAPRAEVDAFIASAKPSVICGATHPELSKIKSEMCAPFSHIWQVSTARFLAIATMIGGGVLIGLVLFLSLAAFGRRSIQYVSFVTGKQAMIWGSAAEVVAQGVMLVWLSFWVTAFFFKIYIIKLIAIVAILVGLAVMAAVVGIFKRNTAIPAQHGELIGEADAPRLWARIRQMASRLNTPAPKQIVAGIDANFFVTESPLRVADRVLDGRTLYVSLPLLRKLETGEADAVLAHELAHLSGGDTANSARLGPALQHYDQYCAAMGSGGATVVVHPLLMLYRILFEVALARSRREREFRADRVAAELVSPQGIGKSLVKVAAYSLYRAKVEGDLFEQRTQHTGALGIAATIDSGLADYVHSPAFMERIGTAPVPHPFDSHPPLADRMHAVGLAIPAEHYAAVASETPATTWASEINTADAIENRLWGAFDAAFAAEHERVLAYRYRPADETERALVMKYFPTRVFELKKDARIEVSYAGLRSTKAGDIAWGSVKGMSYKDGTFGDTLTVTLNESEGARTVKIGLPGIGERKAEFQALLGTYWRRDQIMRQMQTETKAQP